MGVVVLVVDCEPLGFAQGRRRSRQLLAMTYGLLLVEVSMVVGGLCCFRCNGGREILNPFDVAQGRLEFRMTA